MKHGIVIIALALTAGGCAAGLSQQDRARLDRLAAENQRLQQRNAHLEQQVRGGAPQSRSASSSAGPNVARTTNFVQTPPAVYNCYLGRDRRAGGGKAVTIRNDKSKGYYLKMELDDTPVIVKRPRGHNYVANGAGVAVLGPGEVCTIPNVGPRMVHGRKQRYHLTGDAYVLSEVQASPTSAALDPWPDSSFKADFTLVRGGASTPVDVSWWRFE